MENLVAGEEPDEKKDYISLNTEPVEIDKDKQVIIVTPAADKIRTRMQNTIKRIIEEKSIKRDEKIEELSQKNQINEIDIDAILSKTDQKFYDEKKRFYLEAYPDLINDPFDMDNLHLLIIEQIIQRNLLKAKQKRPNKEITDSYERSLKRISKLMEDLSVRRTDRLGKKDNGKKTVNIASLSMNFSDSNGIDLMQERLSLMNNEEKEIMDRKKLDE